MSKEKPKLLIVSNRKNSDFQAVVDSERKNDRFDLLWSCEIWRGKILLESECNQGKIDTLIIHGAHCSKQDSPESQSLKEFISNLEPEAQEMLLSNSNVPNKALLIPTKLKEMIGTNEYKGIRIIGHRSRYSNLKHYLRQ